MVTTFDVAVFAFFFPGAVWFGYRAVRNWSLSRELADAERASTDLVDGEPAVVRGEVTVEEPPDASDRLFDDASTVGAYLWRATFPKSGSNEIDLQEGEISQSTATFASGFETGSFAVADGGRSVEIDPSWLVESHEATPLSDVTAGGITRSKTFHTYLWDSPYVHCAGDATERSLAALRGIVTKHNGSVDLDDYFVEATPIRDGDALAVRGEVAVERGEPVLRGTDGRPLTLSDEGFDDQRATLRRRALKTGAGSLVLLAIAGQFLLVDVASGLL